MVLARGQFDLKSLLIVVAAVAVGLALAPRDAPYWGLLLPAALVAGRAVPRATAMCCAMGLAFFALGEVGLHFPIPGWIYATLAIGIASATWPQANSPHRRRRFAVVGLVFLLTATLYWVPWSSRKPFLQDLDGIKPGMTVAEVQRRMAGYKTGTGIVLPGQAQEFLVGGAMVFRHSDAPEFNADWGIVNIRDGRVVSVDFSAD